ncbi:MAG: hypothetical protein HYX34_08750 [Actinobacteria bacterium]|nr:hypothetical protein [Actinomycetota bacterium]
MLAVVRQDDPLAYGINRLRDARTVLAGRQGDQAERDLAAVTEASAATGPAAFERSTTAGPPPIT